MEFGSVMWCMMQCKDACEIGGDRMDEARCAWEDWQEYEHDMESNSPSVFYFPYYIGRKAYGLRKFDNGRICNIRYGVSVWGSWEDAWKAADRLNAPLGVDFWHAEDAARTLARRGL